MQRSILDGSRKDFQDQKYITLECQARVEKKNSKGEENENINSKEKKINVIFPTVKEEIVYFKY